MKIRRIQITSAATLNFDFTSTAPICVFRGRYSDLALDLVREVIGDRGVGNDPDRVDGGRFVIHADMEMDNQNYRVCYSRNADDRDETRFAVNLAPNSVHFSEIDTREYVNQCNRRDTDNSNVLMKTADIVPCADDRPIFIYDYFDRLDEAIDITPILDKLSSLGRQVFVSVCANYPVEKLKHDAVQIVHTVPLSAEVAWRIKQDKSLTFAEKHKAWTEIMANLPDCEFISEDYSEANIDSVHNFLSEYMALENRLLERFYKKESNAVYTYKVWCDEDGDWLGGEGPLYVDFNEALAEFQSDADLCPRLARFTKVYFGAEHQRIYIYMRPDGAVTKVAADLIDLDKNEYKTFYEIFYGMDLVFNSESDDTK